MRHGRGPPPATLDPCRHRGHCSLCDGRGSRLPPRAAASPWLRGRALYSTRHQPHYYRGGC
eukprot:6387971-Alexandrium_andersonii.AAC.1